MILFRFLSILGGLLVCASIAHGQHRCSADALKQAKALLQFHVGSDANAAVDDSVKVLAPLRNPVNRRQFFDVLEARLRLSCELPDAFNLCADPGHLRFDGSGNYRTIEPVITEP
jgi:hypothetical protein